ncbi:MAG: triose-phosphate isomerase [Phycisphaerales bacterium]|nr:triose-phosphate isomerase [Phycisphaerales bacterium]
MRKRIISINPAFGDRLLARKSFVGGNWKMNLNQTEASAWPRAWLRGVQAKPNVDVAVFPALVHIQAVATALASVSGHGVKLGAQDVYTQPNGAFTGEVSLAMLKDLGVQVVLIGHSERRHVLGESDVLVNQKVRASLEAGFEVILCVGEKLEQREAGMTDFINMAQTLYGLAGVKPEQMSKVTIAYEPVWAIGTGKTATPADAQNAHKAIRSCLTAVYGQAIADGVRIQYGGSMKGSNAKELIGQPDVDGGLIGGASLKADDFMAIINAA